MALRDRLGCSGVTSSAKVKDTHAYLCTDTLSSLCSFIPCLCLAVSLGWNPSKLAGIQHRGLSPRRLYRGPSCSCELFLGMDLGSISLFSFCLVQPSLAQPGLLFSLIPLSGTLWMVRLSFNYPDPLSLLHTNTHIYDYMCICVAIHVEVTFIYFNHLQSCSIRNHFRILRLTYRKKTALLNSDYNFSVN